MLKAQVPGVSMRPLPRTYADDLLRCSATVGNLGERGEPGILTYYSLRYGYDIHVTISLYSEVHLFFYGFYYYLEKYTLYQYD